MEIKMKDLLEAGVHFGHQTRRWNPKMARYIFAERNDIYILDLQKTMRGLKRAGKFLASTVAKGGTVLFVSTKKQAQEIIEGEAAKCGAYWVTQRWLGGMMTNFQTISKRIKHLKQLEKMQEDGVFEVLGKKEEARLRKQKGRLEKYLAGIADMKGLPDAMIIVDPRRETIALSEARKLKIPTVAIVDTNCDPDEVDYVIPGNDDAIRSIKVIAQYLAGCMGEAIASRNAVKAAAAAEKVATEEAEKPKKRVVRKTKPKEDAPEAEAAAPEAPEAPEAEAPKAEAPEAEAAAPEAEEAPADK